jgi:hypothetical protein
MASVLAVALVVGPVSAATASAAGNTVVAQAGQTGIVKGTVTDTGGAPLQGATITATGPKNTSTTTGSDGSFSLTLPAGIYSFTATRTGYEPAQQTDFVIIAGTTSPLTVSLAAITLTSLREIGRVSVSRGRSTFNASPASVATVSNATFSEQGQLQVQRILDQTPGIVIEHPGTSANNATPGNITFPAIRGGLGFETASLIDGHPLAVQNFGDYVTSFLNADVLSGAEVIKGPGAASPQINYAINGVVNFRTLDPTSRQTGQIKYGMDSYGGQFSNFRYSNTFGGKLGIVLDYAINGTPGPFGQNGGQYPVIPAGSFFLYNCASFTSAGPGATCQAQNGSAASTSPTAPAVNRNNPTNANSTAVLCCVKFGSVYDNKTELAKVRYNFSPSTVATVSYLGSQTWVDQNGNTSISFPTTFCPLLSGTTCVANGYNGPLVPGQQVLTAQSVFFPPEFEINNEPIFQAEIRSSIGHDTILARYYAASINRTLQDSFSNNLSTYFQQMTVNGVLKICPAGYSACGGTGQPAAVTTVFNNQSTMVAQTGNYFEQAEEDKLHGASFEYDHFFGDSGNLISVAYDQMNANTDAYTVGANAPASCTNLIALQTCTANSAATIFPSFSIWGGSAVKYGTLLVRGIFNLGSQWNLTLSNYFDSYSQTYTSNGGSTNIAPSNFLFSATTFNTAVSNRYDPRVALTFRPSSDLSIRMGAGSGVAPPYLSLLDSGASAAVPVLDTSATGCASTCAKNTLKTGTLKPETSFGYNLGFDARVSKDGQSILSMDAYMNNLRNQFLTTTFQNGTVAICSGGTSGATGSLGVTNGPAPCQAGGTVITVPLYTSGSVNLDNSRYMGLEFRLARDPALGFGGMVQGALIKAYPYNLNPCIYSTALTSTGVQNCTPPVAGCTACTNLGVVSGTNFFASGPSGTSTFNVVSNHGIPYSQGYAELHWRYPRGGFLAFREQYYGPNNSLNVPAFFVAGASARFPINDSSLLGQISADNLFRAYPNVIGTQFGGVGVPLVNGQTGLTNANVIGPTVWRFSLTKEFGNR